MFVLVVYIYPFSNKIICNSMSQLEKCILFLFYFSNQHHQRKLVDNAFVLRSQPMVTKRSTVTTSTYIWMDTHIVKILLMLSVQNISINTKHFLLQLDSRSVQLSSSAHEEKYNFFFKYNELRIYNTRMNFLRMKYKNKHGMKYTLKQFNNFHKIVSCNRRTILSCSQSNVGCITLYLKRNCHYKFEIYIRTQTDVYTIDDVTKITDKKL